MAQQNGVKHDLPIRKYGPYQSEIYAIGMRDGVKPAVTKDPNKLEGQAKEVMSASGYSYIAGGAGERATMDANRLAFRQWKILPRMLRDTTTRDLRIKLFGKTYPTPCLFAPIGVQSIFHSDGEKGVAEIAGEIGIPFVMSTASSFSMQEICAANDNGAKNGEHGHALRWYQLYWPQTEAITESLLDTASKNGFDALVVTLDTWALAWRPWDLDHAWVPFFQGIGNKIGFTDPVFRKQFKDKTGKEVEDDIRGASLAWIADVFSGASHSWEQLAHIRKHWKGPILLKGIQHPDDAVKAHECGMDGVVVSNHGGRQCDGAVASLQMLPEIADAVRGKRTPSGEDFTVIFDSGIRTGVDVIKALCLGAKAVLVGRPWVYGLGINGKHGAKDAMLGLLADVDQSLGLAGIKTIDDCTRSMLRKVEYPGDSASSN